MKITQKQAISIHKFGIDLKVYDTKNKNVDLVFINTKRGHFEEFYHKKSTFIYYVIEGRGAFYLNGKKVSVKPTDVIVAPPLTKIYYLGKMKLILITTPAWQEKHEVHVRYIGKNIK